MKRNRKVPGHVAESSHLHAPDGSSSGCVSWGGEDGAAALRLAVSPSPFMPSPGARRSSWVNGSRCEPGASSRRRASSCSCPGGGSLSSRRLSLPFAAVALRSLLAVDLWLSRRLGVCAAEDSLLGGIRPLVKLLELSAHRTPWVSSAMYLLLTSRIAEEQELVINLLMGETELILICLSVHPSIRPSVRPSVHPSIHPSTHPYIHLSV
ncbi:hypothetical protein NFI96_005189 [Prochilodus magdalenae]|nr:hypothetical protein NFI96_005189 [Prochilodus magdalenae]